MTPAVVIRRPGRVHTAGQLALDPFARFARVTADEKSQPRRRRVGTAMRTYSAAPSLATVSWIKGIVAGPAANAVSSEQSMGHRSIREWPRVASSLDGHVDHGWIDGARPRSSGTGRPGR